MRLCACCYCAFRCRLIMRFGSFYRVFVKATGRSIISQMYVMPHSRHVVFERLSIASHAVINAHVVYSRGVQLFSRFESIRVDSFGSFESGHWFGSVVRGARKSIPPTPIKLINFLMLDNKIARYSVYHR